MPSTNHQSHRLEPAGGDARRRTLVAGGGDDAHAAAGRGHKRADTVAVERGTVRCEPCELGNGRRRLGPAGYCSPRHTTYFEANHVQRQLVCEVKLAI